jgi:small subunit ribosomal protein S20
MLERSFTLSEKSFTLSRGLTLANHPSALKRERQSIKRRDRNRAVTSSIRTAVKKVQKAISEKNADGVKTAFHDATSMLDRAASKGVIPSKRASRKISRLAAKVNAVLSTPAPPPEEKESE